MSSRTVGAGYTEKSCLQKVEMGCSSKLGVLGSILCVETRTIVNHDSAHLEFQPSELEAEGSEVRVNLCYSVNCIQDRPGLDEVLPPDDNSY